MRIKTQITILMGLAVVLTSIIFGTISYQSQKSSILKGIDQKLFSSANFAKALLPEDYHNNIVGKESVSPEKYLQMIDHYNKLCLKLNLEYLWSLMLINNQIVFTSSTSKDKKVQNGKHALFYDVHTNPEAYKKAFDKMEVDFRINQNKWGHTRIVLVPFHDDKGRKFLFGASMKMSDVDALLYKVMWRSLLIFMGIFVVGIIAVRIFANLITQPLSKLSSIANKIADSGWEQQENIKGSFEIEALSKSINNMIVNRKQVEQAFQESEYKFRSLFEQAGDYIIVLEPQPDGPPVIVDVNQAAIDKHGYTRDEFIGMRISDLDEEVSKDVNEERVKQLLEGKHLLFEVTHRKKDGSHFFAETSVKLLEIPEKPPLFISLERDITKRKQAEEAVIASEAYLKKILNNLGDPVFVKDDQHRMTLVNDAFCSTFGLSRDMIIGNTLAEHSPPDEIEHFFEIDRQVLTDGRENVCEEELTVKSGRTLTIITKKTRYIDENGDKFLIGVIRDITEQKQAEENKANLEERLQQAQKMEAIGTLAGGIAHDFNNILSAVLGYAEMARDDCPTGSSIAKDLDQVLKASNRAKDLVKGILAFSRQDVAERKPIQLGSIVKETIKMLRSSLPTTIDINQNISLETGLVLADPTQINQILMNIGTNAFHALEEQGGTIDFTLKETILSSEDLVRESNVEAGAFIQLSVCDSGPGITQETKERIFDPYFTTKQTGKGTGMGLSIVHGIVKSYGGFISLYSEIGEGTAFHVFLPVAKDGAIPEVETEKQIEGGKERILFVDDEEILTQMSKDMLERLGYHVTVRNSSLEALEIFQNQPDQFDVVITDQTMPGMTGSDLARRMMKIRPSIPIVLCTGYSTIISEEKAKGIGIKEFALKPLAKKDIAQLIRKVLGSA